MYLHIDKVLYDEYWLMAMHEELNQFKRKEAVWDLVPKPAPHKLIKTKWVFRNKLDESGIIARNKPRLVAKGMNKKISRVHKRRDYWTITIGMNRSIWDLATER